MSLELQSEPLSEPQLRQRLEPALRELRGPATLGDVVAATGLPAERTEPVLRSLLDQFNGKLAVDDNGELIYGFPRGLHRRRSAREVLQQIVAALGAAIKVAYKVGISVMLVAYFVIFVVIAIAALLALASSGRDSDHDLGGGIDLDGCGDGCGNVLFWMPIPVPVSTEPDRYTVRYDRFGRAVRMRVPGQTRRKPRDPDALPFWKRVYEFVFGQDPVPVEPLAVERELLAFLRDNEGRVTAAELAALRGISLEEAEKLALHLMVEHGGDVDVSESGSLVYRFDQLMVSAQAQPTEQTRRWTWWWERAEAPAQLNRNTPGQNAAIVGLNLFNLIASVVLGQYLWSVGAGLAGVIGLGIFPFLFSASLFVIPLARYLRLPAERKAQEVRNKRRGWLQKLFGGQGELALRGDPDLQSFAVDYEGEPDVDQLGAPAFRFKRIEQELADARAAREQVDPQQFRLGPIAYDSETD